MLLVAALVLLALTALLVMLEPIHVYAEEEAETPGRRVLRPLDEDSKEMLA